MKSNKGFTLIELLAVIVILAIIALIATPIILGVIETARKGSAESSALGFIDAVEKQIAIDMLATESEQKISSYTPGNTLTVSQLANVPVKGTRPESGTIETDINGAVKTGTCLVVKLGNNSYVVTYDGSKASATSGTSCPTS